MTEVTRREILNTLWNGVVVTAAAGLPPVLLKGEAQAQASEASALMFASEETKALYAPLFRAAMRRMPAGSKLLVLTRRDVAPPNVDWTKHDLSVLSAGCGFVQPTLKTDAVHKLVADAQQNIQNIVWKFSEEQGLFSPQELRDLARQSSADYNSVFSALAASLITDTPGAAYSPGGGFKQITTRTSIIALPDALRSPLQLASILSDLPQKYLKNITGTPEDWASFIINHEVVGHAGEQHFGDGEHYCSVVNHDILLDSVNDESAADIAAAQTYYEAQKRGDVSSADIPRQAAAMRALSAFYQGRNAGFMENTPQAHSHITTFLFDPDAPGLGANIDLADYPDAHGIPAVINQFADIVSGFLFMQEMKRRVAANPEKYDPKERDAVNANVSTPQGLLSYLAWYCEYGQNMRTSKSSLPQYHAAMVYLKESGAIEQVRETIPKLYHALFDDIFADYFKAADFHASSELNNPDNLAEMRKLFLGESKFDFSKVMQWYRDVGGQKVFFYEGPVATRAADLAPEGQGRFPVGIIVAEEFTP